MRFVFASTAATALIAGTALMGMAPAFAQNVDAGNPYFDHAEGTMSTNAGAVTQPSGGSYLATHHQYMQMDPRDAKADQNASTNVDQADASNPYFNHAEGTMSGPTAVPPPSTSGQYVASYHQYMQVEPRDTKVVKNGAQDDNIYYYHAEGTMAHP